MNLEKPKGWLDVDLSRAGGPSEFGSDDDIADSESEDDEAELERLREIKLGDDAEAKKAEIETLKRRKLRRQNLNWVGRGSTLRCFLLQIRILENNQNGKDTHLRGFQVFGKDEEAAATKRRRRRAAGEPNRVSTEAQITATELDVSNKSAALNDSGLLVGSSLLDAPVKDRLERARRQTGGREVLSNGGAIPASNLDEAMGSRGVISSAEAGSEAGWQSSRASTSAKHDARSHQPPGSASGFKDMHIEEPKRGRRLRDSIAVRHH